MHCRVHNVSTNPIYLFWNFHNFLILKLGFPSVPKNTKMTTVSERSLKALRAKYANYQFEDSFCWVSNLFVCFMVNFQQVLSTSVVKLLFSSEWRSIQWSNLFSTGGFGRVRCQLFSILVYWGQFWVLLIWVFGATLGSVLANSFQIWSISRSVLSHSCWFWLSGQIFCQT